MSPLTALLDASVLYTAPLRDFLMYLALTDIARICWPLAVLMNTRMRNDGRLSA